MRTPLFLALAALLVPSIASADWPTFRHDARRTAIAPGTSTITQPAKYWQYYVGGTLRPSSHLAVDVDKDGVTDVVYIAGGKVLAKLPDDRLVWESPPIELQTLHAVVDLDGDGVNEVIASGTRNVYVLSGANGSVLWKQPNGEVGNVGGVRVGDLDGDKKPELVIDDCACCGISPTASPPGAVYKFDKVSAPTKLYAPNTRGHCGSQAVTLLDADGDGVMEVAYGSNDNYILTAGKDGAVLGASTPAGENLYYSSCEAANVDGRPGDELICFQNSYLDAAGTGGHRVTVFTYDAAATPKLKTLWNVATASKVTGQMIHVGSSVSDLDGDGRTEIVVSFSAAGAAYATTVYDAGTGAALATIDGERIAGVVDLDGDKKPEILTYFASGLRARKYERGGTPPISLFATIPDAAIAWQFDLGRAQRTSNSSQPLAIDLKGDGKSAAIFSYPATATTKARYAATRFDATGKATVAASYEIPEGLSILTTQVWNKVNRPYPQLLVTRNDGYLIVLDDVFAATNGITYGTGEFKTFLPGMRVGGFIGAPIAPRLDGTTDAIVVTDSRGTLIRLAAASAWMAQPPKIVWEERSAHSPSTVAGVDSGKPAIVCNKGGSVAALGGAGGTLWTRTPTGNMTHDALGGDVNKDGVDDVFTASMSGGAVVNLQVYNGKTGAPVWAAPHSVPLNWGFQPFSVADHNGDGVADFFAVPNTVRVLDGATGNKLAENTTFLAYFTPTIDDVDGDGIAEVTLSSGYFPTRTWKKDLTTQVWIGGDDRPYQHGARAACGARSVWVQPSLQYPGLVRLTTMNGADVGKLASLYLAGGALFATEAAASASGKFLGTLGNVAIKKDLLGTGDHPEALIGSTDGNLYALDPCAAKLDWAFDARFAVGDPILADTNGDGADEILVPAADGYLHAVSQRTLAAPAEVNDNDPFGALPAADVDEVATADRLGVSWTAVVGADGYQVAVLTEGGSYVTQPDWVDVGAATNVVLKNLSLSIGKKYFASVRAIGKTGGSSNEMKSDGVVVRAPPMMDGGLGDAMLGPEDTGSPATDGTVTDTGDVPLGDAPPTESSGCGCRHAATSAAPGWFAFALLALLRRRR